MSRLVPEDQGSNGFSLRLRVIVGTTLLLGFTVYLLLQHWLVFPYSDDWGYATLTYTSEQTGFQGSNFSEWQLLRFLYNEYLSWSGRFFPFFIQINLFKVGLDAVRLVQVAVIMAIVCLSVRLTPVRKIRTLWLVVPMVYFMALPEFSVVGGLYWFSASIAYVWGIAVFMLALQLIRTSGRLTWPATLLLAVAALFHEQMAVAMVAFTAGYLLLAIYDTERTIRLASLRLLSRGVPVLVAACLVILAPGNFARKANSSYASDHLLANVAGSARSIADYLLNTAGGYWILGFMALSMAVFAWRSLAHSALGARARIILCFVTLVLLYIASWLSFLLFVSLLMGLYGGLLLNCRRHIENGSLLVCVYLAALASLILLLLAPVVAGRSLLIFYFLMLLPVTQAFTMLGEVRRGKVLATVAIVVALPPSLDNAADIFSGYAANRSAHVTNDAKLRVYRHGLHAGHHVADAVVLERLPNDRYAETMPYERPLVEIWMKKYYGLPESTRFVWRE